MEKENILGFDVCNTNIEDLCNSIFNDFKNNVSNFIVNINPEIIINNYKNKKIIKLLNKENYQIPDGVGILYASKLKKGNIYQRITGIDLMQRICAESINYNSKIFLYGGKGDISQKAQIELQKLHPKINIVGTCNGFIDENLAIDSINKSNANILFVGLGSPKQEKFIIDNRDHLPNIKIFMPVGRKF